MLQSPNHLKGKNKYAESAVWGRDCLYALFKVHRRFVSLPLYSGDCLWAPRGFSPALGSVLSDTAGGIADDSNPTFYTSLMFSYVFEFI